MSPQPDHPFWRAILPGFAVLILLGLWYAVKGIWQIHDFLLPAPHDVFHALLREAPALADAARVTFVGALLGFLGAVTLGFALSLALAVSRWLRHSLYPLVIFMQMIPILATAAIIVILFDVGIHSVALVAFLIGFFPIVASTLHGLLSVPPEQTDLFRLYKASTWQELVLLRIPSALPSFFTGAKIAATLAVIGAVTGEIFAGSSSGAGGLGFRILIYKAELKTDAVYAATLLCCLLGFAFVGAVVGMRKWILPPDRA